MRRRGDRLGRSSSPGEYHALRIRARRFRYALEFHEGVYGKSASRLIRSLERVQEILGRYQDADVLLAHVRSLLALHGRRLSPAERAGIGPLLQHFEGEANALRRRFRKAYRRVEGKRWRRLRKLLRQRRPPTASEEPIPSIPETTDGTAMIIREQSSAVG
jgi:CHAD domain-containing protein